MKPSIKLGDKYLSNSCQTTAYINAGLAGSCWKRCNNTSCCCEDDGTAHTSPAADLADWYNPANVCSEQYLGMLLESVEYGEPYTVRVRDTLGGGFIQAKNLRAREIRVVGYLVGSTECGIQYGLDYLNSVLSKADCSTGDCALPDAEVVLCCDQGSAAKGTKTLKQVSAITSVVDLDFDSEYRSCRARVEFTLAAQIPYFFEQPADLNVGLVFDENVVCPNWCCGCQDTTIWPDCLNANTGSNIGFSDIAGGASASCYCEPVFIYPVCAPVPAAGLFNDFVSWRLNTPTDLVNVSIQYLESPDGVTDSPVDNPSAYQCVTPIRLTAGFIPANHTLIYDSTIGQASVENSAGQTVEFYGIGGGSPIILGCNPGFICVYADTCNPTAGATFSTSLTVGTL